MRFSIIVVCLNAGDELAATINSILSQTYKDYEIIVKDAGSTDGSTSDLPQDERIHLIVSKDHGIYDAMNQALELARGEFVYFLNCGDYFYDDTVLEKVSDQYENLLNSESKEDKHEPVIIYGDIFERVSKSRVMSNPEMDEFACYRNVPCHQACFYERTLIKMHPFEIQYKVRADYEQFLWCYFIGKVRLSYIDVIISSYMGGGFSETKANRKLSTAEHSEVVRKYMSERNIRRYKLRLLLSMQPLRAKIAMNPVTSGIYNKFKSAIYKR